MSIRAGVVSAVLSLSLSCGGTPSRHAPVVLGTAGDIDDAAGVHVVPQKNHAMAVLDVAYSPDGRYAATTAQDGVRIWALDSGLIIRIFDGLGLSSRFTADGRKLRMVLSVPLVSATVNITGKAVTIGSSSAVPSANTTLAIVTVDTTTWKVERRLPILFGRFVTLSPDGNTAAYLLPPDAKWDGVKFETTQKIKVIDAGSGAERRVINYGRIEQHPKVDMLGLALSPDGKRLAVTQVKCTLSDSNPSGSVLDVSLRIWDVESGKARAVIAVPKTQENCLPGPVAFSASGTRLITVHGKPGNAVMLWDVQSGKLVRSRSTRDLFAGAFTPPAACVNCPAVQLSPDESRFAVGGRGGVAIVDTVSGEVRGRDPLDAVAVAFSKDGATLLAAGNKNAAGESFVRLDGTTAARREAFGLKLAPVVALAVATTKPWVIANVGATLHTWDLDELRVRSELVLPATGTAMALSRDDAVVVWGESDSRRFTVRTGDLSRRAPSIVFEDVRFQKEGSCSGRAVAFSADGSRIIALANHGLCDEGDAFVFDASTGKVVQRLKTGNAGFPSVAVISPDGRHIALSGPAGGVEVWNVERGTKTHTLGDRLADGKLWPVMAAAFTRDGGRLLFVSGGSLDGIPRISVVDLADGRIVATIAGPAGMSVGRLAVSSDGKLAVSSPALCGMGECSLGIWDLANGRFVRKLASHASFVADLAFSNDARLVVTATHDGATRLTRVDNGEWVAMIAAGDEWLIYGRDGYFDASRRGGELTTAVDGGRAFRIDQIAARNNRPDILLERMGIGDPDLIAHFKARHALRLKKLGIAEGKLGSGFESAPTASIKHVRRDGRHADIELDFASASGQLAHYQVFVNDVPLFPGLGKQISGRAAHARERIALGAGGNKIEASVIDAAGVESLRPFHRIDSVEQVKGDLYFLGFGVSKYKDAKLDLGFAHKDALDLAAIFAAAKGGAFANVHVRTYVDEQVTVENIRKAKDFFASAKVDDTIVMFVAGHGTHAGDAAAEYYYVTHDADVRRLPQTAAKFELLEALLQDVAPRRKLLLLDTCESGDRDDAEESRVTTIAKTRGLVPRSTRGLERVGGTAGTTTSTSTLPVKRRSFLGHRERYIYNDLTRRTGAVVFSSSRGGEVSFELDTLQNGVFTEEVMTALVTDAADADKDGFVSTDELRTYVARAVAGRTTDLQHPVVDRDNLEARFGLPVVPAAAAVLTRHEAPRPR